MMLLLFFRPSTIVVRLEFVCLTSNTICFHSDKIGGYGPEPVATSLRNGSHTFQRSYTNIKDRNNKYLFLAVMPRATTMTGPAKYPQ